MLLASYGHPTRNFSRFRKTSPVNNQLLGMIVGSNMDRCMSQSSERYVVCLRLLQPAPSLASLRDVF